MSDLSGFGSGSSIYCWILRGFGVKCVKISDFLTFSGAKMPARSENF